MSWLERRVFEWGSILDGRWSGKFDSRRELGRHLEMKPHIDAALTAYPGVFSKRLAEDWTRVAESLRGRKVELSADALSFREQGDVIKQEIAAAGEAAWTKYLADNKAVDTLPSVDLVRDDRTPIVGKVIALPQIGWSGSVKDGDRPVFVASHSDYNCYIAADQPSMRTFWERQADYQARVEPRVPRHTTSSVASPRTRSWWSRRAAARRSASTSRWWRCACRATSSRMSQARLRRSRAPSARPRAARRSPRMTRLPATSCGPMCRR